MDGEGRMEFGISISVRLKGAGRWWVSFSFPLKPPQKGCSHKNPLLCIGHNWKVSLDPREKWLFLMAASLFAVKKRSARFMRPFFAFKALDIAASFLEGYLVAILGLFPGAPPRKHTFLGFQPILRHFWRGHLEPGDVCERAFAGGLLMPAHDAECAFCAQGSFVTNWYS